jgi:DNA-binding NtrC family response regulator
VTGLQVVVASSVREQRNSLAKIIGQLGLQPITAEDVSAVRAILARQSVHLLFCQDDLPGGGFRETLRLARRNGSGAILVVCSLLGEVDQYLNAMDLGAFDFIAPPYRSSEVETIVDRVRKDRTEGTRSHIQAGGMSQEKIAAA